jgi:hypothetical protein
MHRGHRLQVLLQLRGTIFENHSKSGKYPLALAAPFAYHAATNWPVRLSVRTPGFQPGKRGSIPLRAAIGFGPADAHLCLHQDPLVPV